MSTGFAQFRTTAATVWRRPAPGNTSSSTHCSILRPRSIPYFNIAYRFGAIFLSEGYPGGPGRPDQAIALLRKGISAQPTKWQYYHDVAFVYYWQLRDMEAAARWFRLAATQPNAPNWLEPVAATMLIEGGDRASARFLLQQILQSEEAWLQRMAPTRPDASRRARPHRSVAAAGPSLPTTRRRSFQLGVADSARCAARRADRSQRHAFRARSRNGRRPRVAEIRAPPDAGARRRSRERSRRCRDGHRRWGCAWAAF